MKQKSLFLLSIGIFLSLFALSVTAQERIKHDRDSWSVRLDSSQFYMLPHSLELWKPYNNIDSTETQYKRVVWLPSLRYYWFEADRIATPPVDQWIFGFINPKDGQITQTAGNFGQQPSESSCKNEAAISSNCDHSGSCSIELWRKEEERMTRSVQFDVKPYIDEGVIFSSPVWKGCDVFIVDDEVQNSQQRFSFKREGQAWKVQIARPGGKMIEKTL